MAPIIPTRRPLVTPLRIAAVTVVVAVASALVLFMHQPVRTDGRALAETAAVMCVPLH